ncbi:TonB-dependent receptor [Aliiglaciecola sp. 2_MG-2023]|uniref:TonB-dependent receptor n=1 Tax=unclassified Aliiglaciecola TaxID=2593648 RepID=UPI0026E28A64|nr:MULTISPECIES: TonB-dependent receptor [unclassified Aliiglaciecola]MDO6710735.1 TonB-dependent receptor [Aliiglaciecola sp. 2_MG-2023]MDO6751857.1 TonB-dependent receptor [Aliiglaciecola sp. 1_MG-2023]
MINSKLRKYVYIAGTAFALSPIATTLVHAQDAGAETEVNSNSLERITVSARKTDESIIEVPLSIQAFTSADLKEKGIADLETLANFAPNLDFQNVGNSQPGRYNPGIRFRGMDIAITTPTTQTGGFLVDGVAMLGGASSVSFSDIAQVEVIRGPQPVYFGRGTFGGAINYTTVTPTSDFNGGVSVNYSPTFGSQELEGYVEGEVIENLNARLTAFSRKQGAPFTANDGGELGEEKTTGVSLIVSFTPTDDLSIKTRFAYSEDDDGATSGTFVPFSIYNNISAGDGITIPTNNGIQDVTFTQPWLTGSLPTIDVSNNATFYDLVVAGQPMFDQILADGTYNTLDLLNQRPDSGDTPSLNKIGLAAELVVFSLDAEYLISDDYTLSILAGYNKRDTTQIRDSDQTDSEAWITATWLELESWSTEARFTFDNAGKLRWMVGVSKSEIDQMGDVDGGWNVFNGLFGGLEFGYGSSSLDATNIASTGVFGAIEYDFTDEFTAVFEGRYQEDTSITRGGVSEATLTDAVEQDYDAFLPRVSLQYKPNADTNVFLTYSEALLPGSYNAQLDSIDQDDAAAFLAENPNVQKTTGEESLASYELGLKQAVLDGSVWYSLVAFYQEWEGMKSSGLYTFFGASTGTPYFLNPTMEGSSTQQGIEAEGRWQVSQNLNVQFAYGYTESEYDSYYSNSFRSVLGLPYGTFLETAGNTLPRSPKHSGAIGVSWKDTLNSEWDYSARADLTYRGKTYTDELNLTTIDSYSLLSLSLGFQHESGIDVELYCKNCTDEDGWATGRRNTDFSAIPNFFTSQGAVVDPIMPREVGVKVAYAF